jgi:hypothetical protein
MTQRTSMGSRRTPRGGMMGRWDVSMTWVVGFWRRLVGAAGLLGGAGDCLRQGVGVPLGVAGSAPRVRGT